MLAWVYAMEFPSVCGTRVLCIKTAKNFVEILLQSDSPIILVFRQWGTLFNSDGFTRNRSTKYRGGNLAILTKKSVYLKNGVRYSHCCYTSWIGTIAKLSNDGTSDNLEWLHHQYQVHPIIWRRISCKQCMLQPATWGRTSFLAIAEVSYLCGLCSCYWRIDFVKKILFCL